VQTLNPINLLDANARRVAFLDFALHKKMYLKNSKLSKLNIVGLSRSGGESEATFNVGFWHFGVVR